MWDTGDVVCTRNPGTGWSARIRRFGAALRDQPNTVDHTVVVHRRDAAGTLWGIEGRPGGVGEVDMRNGMVWRVLNAYGNEVGRRSTQREAHKVGKARA